MPHKIDYELKRPCPELDAKRLDNTLPKAQMENLQDKKDFQESELLEENKIKDKKIQRERLNAMILLGTEATLQLGKLITDDMNIQTKDDKENLSNLVTFSTHATIELARLIEEKNKGGACCTIC